MFTVFAVSMSIPLLFMEFGRVMRRGWRLSSCGTAMEVEPPRAGMLLTNEEVVVVVVVLVPEVEATVVLLSKGKDEGREAGSSPSFGLKPLCRCVVVVPE